MTFQLTLKNIKCSGCIQTVMDVLSHFEGISGSRVDLSTGILTFAADPPRTETSDIIAALANSGYPTLEQFETQS